MDAVALAGTASDTLLLVGCGNMAGAMVVRWRAAGVAPNRLVCVRRAGAPVADGVAVFPSLGAWADAGGRADAMLLGFKPQQLATLAPELDAILAERPMPVLSLLAGIPRIDQAAALPHAAPLFRVMPNMPVATGAGVVLVQGPDDLNPLLRTWAQHWLAPLGLVEWVDDPTQFDVLTAVSGCGPAFVYRLVDAYRAAAERLGVPADQADRLSRATFSGAVAVLRDPDATPGALADAVASPGGMTRAGLDVLDSDGSLPTLLSETLRAARDRGRQLGATTRR